MWRASPGVQAPAPAAGDDRPPPEAERRLVSVLFADLVGFTTLSEGRDPEEVRELLSRYFDAAQKVIGRYGGTVEKFIGDAVMAVWGAPVARRTTPSGQCGRLSTSSPRSPTSARRRACRAYGCGPASSPARQR